MRAAPYLLALSLFAGAASAQTAPKTVTLTADELDAFAEQQNAQAISNYLANTRAAAAIKKIHDAFAPAPAAPPPKVEPPAEPAHTDAK